jgi:hypothetical protein
MNSAVADSGGNLVAFHQIDADFLDREEAGGIEREAMSNGLVLAGFFINLSI